MNKIVLITGATSGFGEACARKFAAAGYQLILTGRRKERLETLKKELEGGAAGTQGPAAAVNVLPLVFDVRDKGSVDSALSQLPEKWKKIDLLINNAGLALGRDFFEEANMDDWETMIDTNVKGLLYVSRAVLPYLIKQRGQIINLGSVAGKQVYEKGNVYCASKFAVDAISQSMRIDMLRHGIKVTVIHPGAADTEFSQVRFKGDKDLAKKIYEGYTPLHATDVADAIFYCASLPAHVCINEMIMTCVAQADAIYFYKNS
ncbi:MAG TPA: SDR family NAD(P)-dependent oxidoreductase [Puia sp.]|jgi:NADP-dependent 3-hydroxy acid dehydrogenase YdfG